RRNSGVRFGGSLRIPDGARQRGGWIDGSRKEARMTDRPRFCERCRAEIPPLRLEAIPDTRLCIACSRQVGGEFTVVAIPENVAKSGSLKRNYGSWGVQRVRRRIKPLR